MGKIINSIRKAPLEYGVALLVVGAIVAGGFAFIASQAAGPYSYADAAKATASDGAKIVSDATAAGGKAVQFAAPVVTAPTTPTTPAPTNDGPRNKGLYRDLRLANDGRPAAISGQPYAVWIGGWSGDPATAAKKHTDAAAAEGKIPTFVMYNIPLRDCGLYSAGGLKDFNEYKTWVDGIATGIGQREAIVIVEPDALAGIDCLSAAQKTDRLNGISNAITALTTKTKAFVYLDAGNASWVPAAEMATRLKTVGVDKIRGFALNVSNFFKVSENITYGTAISKGINNKPFVIDTSRNGQGLYVNANDPEAWCNPPGRGLGIKPTTTTNQTLVDAYLWVKTPGESDGSCKGAPAAGAWYEAYAQELIRNANYTAQ
jgi:endoglucanase